MSNLHDSLSTILVTAATGRQGGATARALLAQGKFIVRVLVRDPAAPNAKALAASGARLVVGDLDDVASLRAACAGVRAVFSMQTPIVSATGIDHGKEVQQGQNLIEAARAEGVDTFVHTATTGVGDHRNVEGWTEGRWKAHEAYWENKLTTCERVKNAGFPHWTLLLPATFVDQPMFDPANFVDGVRLVTVVNADQPIALITADDIGRAAAAAMTDPARWNRVTLQLAGDVRTLPEIAAILSRLDGKPYVVESTTVEAAIAAGQHPGVAQGLTWINAAPVLASPEDARAMGLTPTSFETWAQQLRGLRGAAIGS